MVTREDSCEKGFEISVEDNWVRIQGRGGIVVTNDLLISTLEELHSLDAYRNEKPGSIWDFRGCASNLDFEKILEVKRYIENTYDVGWKHRYTALVVDQDLLYGLARMYEMIAEKIPTTLRVFKDMDEAENWLNAVMFKPQVINGTDE